MGMSVVSWFIYGVNVRHVVTVVFDLRSKTEDEPRTCRRNVASCISIHTMEKVQKVYEFKRRQNHIQYDFCFFPQSLQTCRVPLLG